ncbi:ABC transporter ATP-binding protein [Quadrisphaera sp. GCM10027208]|uniref:ABC transporter ATP-binding protein n=1 Tax=Quadrisphaera sp. GCM10027208 TaxID=3273423 RepID=UPI00361CAD50|nr:ABC transporter ATP-binding protein [Kineosporiaceae bacterium SCSIO 59966]
MSTQTTQTRPGLRGSDALLEIEDLTVTFGGRGRSTFRAVDGVSFSVRPGEVVGLVGESGSGKSVTSLAVMGLLPRRGVDVGGQVLFEGRDVLRASPRELADLRGRDMAMVFQDPMTSLNPVVPIGTQVTEVLLRHTDLDRSGAREEAEQLLRRVGIPDPVRRLGEYPHQLSGGMRQRALIAIALACKPKLLIADEPTTALDVTIQAQVLELLRQLVTETGTAMIMITHDLGVVAGLCDQINVMYAGRIVESAERRELFASPRHRYTAGLLASIPRMDGARGEPLRPIPGSPNDTVPWSQACAFAPRCEAADDDCVRPDLPLDTDEVHPGHVARCVHPVPVDGTEPTVPSPQEHP